MLLLINACARQHSRTLPLAKAAAQKLSRHVEELNLYSEPVRPLDEATLLNRERCIAAGDFSDAMFRFAKQFRAADEIVIAAPYWDLSFPSILKCYVEAICVNSLTFAYNAQGMPESLCCAKKLVYVSTAGGFIAGENAGYRYIEQVCKGFFGITDCSCIQVEGLDIVGANEAQLLQEAYESIQRL